MPSSKEHIALKWALASDEEKNEKRRKHAEAQRRYRAKKGKKERSEMTSDQIVWKRELDKKNQRKRRNKLTKEEEDTIKAKDKERKKKYRQEKKNKKDKGKEVSLGQDSYFGKSDLDKLEEKKIKQQKKNCKIKRKIRDKMTAEEKEKIHVDLVKRSRMRQSVMTIEGKLLAGMKAKEGMRVCRKFGYLREYKQRRIRDYYDPSKYGTIGVDKYGYSSRSWLYKRKQERTVRKRREKKEHKKTNQISRAEFIRKNEEELKRKDELKRKNRVRVNRHRMKVKKLLQDPVFIDDYGPKGDYELLREKNIRELERLKKESGLFN